jgi:hypothetical protein
MNERSYERLGNYSLLERPLNAQQAGNAAFPVKQQAYAQSQYQTSRELIEYTEWTEEAIARRQARMAGVAKAVWALAI